MPPSAPHAGTPAVLAAQFAAHSVTAGDGNPQRRVFPGRAEQVARARRFVGRALDGCPVADQAMVCVSELASNAIVHTRTGQGGTFQVIVWRGRSSACVAVLDGGSPTRPAPRRPVPGTLAESGYGLTVVQELAACWGHHRHSDGSWHGGVVWFRIDWNPG
jgi:anti-sigma regulatory factor (Ser/Thr protein kinase)